MALRSPGSPVLHLPLPSFPALPSAAVRSGSWQPALLVAGFLALLADLLLHGAALRADVAVHALAGVPRSPRAESAALVVDRLGLRQTTVPPVVLLAVLLGRRVRTWRPVLLVSGALLALNLVVGVLKLVLGRGESVAGDPSFLVGGQAFPSGHSSNAALAAVLLVHLAGAWRGRPVRRRTAVLAVGLPCLVMTAVSLFLGFHWLSDLVSGLLVGLLVAWVALRVDRHVQLRRDTRAPAPGALPGPVAGPAPQPCGRPAGRAARRPRHPLPVHAAPRSAQGVPSGPVGRSSRRAPITAACTTDRCSGSVGPRSSTCRTRARR